MLREGCEQDNFVVVTVGDMRYSSMNPWPTDYSVKKGDLVLVDWGGTYNGYWSDLTRVFAMGSITAHQKMLYDATNAMREIATQAARPGVPVGEIDKAATEFATEQGLIDYMLHRSGHAIGLQIHEIPSIDATNQTLMAPGMCLTIEPALYDFAKAGPSKGAFRIEDLVSITEEGREVYSPGGTELVIL
jgi:Xaa-Pro dipeptidase